MDEMNIEKLNLRFINLLRDYENKDITFDDVSKYFSHEELIGVLENSVMYEYMISILKTMDLPVDFQEQVNERWASQAEEGYYSAHLTLVSDHILLDKLSNAQNGVDEMYMELFKTDEARLSALTLRTVKKDSDKVIRLLENMKDDNLKLKYIHLAGKNDLSSILLSIKDARLQEVAIEKYPKHSSYLISNLENEEMRIYYYERYFKKLGDFEKATIFKSFSLENQEKYLDRYWKHLSEDEKIMQLSRVKDDSIILKKIPMLSSDMMKIKLINSLKDEHANLVAEIEKTISYDKSKKLIKLIVDEGLQFSFSELNTEKLFSQSTDKEKLKFIEESLGHRESLSILLTMHEFNNVEKVIEHCNSFPEYDEKYNSILQKYAENYNVNYEHLVHTVKSFGYEILKNIKLDRLQKIINLDDVSFAKTMGLFDVSKHQMDNATLNDNINLFLQRKFKLQNPNIINISSDIRLNIQNGQREEALKLINQIINEYDINNVLTKYNYNSEEFIKSLFDKGESDEKLTTCLLEITNGYIVHKRNEYIQNNIVECYQKFANQDFDAKEALKFVIANYPISMIKKDICNQYMITTENGYTQEEVEFTNNPTALENIINFKRNPSQYQIIPEDVKKYTPVFSKLFEKEFSHNMNLNIVGAELKEVYTPIAYIDQQSLRDAFLTIEPEMFKNGVLSDSNKYQLLSDVLEKYKLFGYNSRMNSDFVTVELDTSGYNIGNLITYFPMIYNELNTKIEKGEIKNITLPALLDMAECYSSNSDKLSILFGKDNARLLSSNPGPNSASMGKEQRLIKAQECLKVMNDRKTVTVPSFDQDFELSNGKKMNIVVGNISDPINLTYGERTGACMRIGGHADSLFNFCLKDENGFHIRFSNPEDNKFASRVSGFRNGNTVFLNELRFSVDASYTNSDVKEACTLAAQELIRQSKDSNSPIENVVIAPEYVMSDSKTVDLKVDDIKKGLGNFYSDIASSNATILATTNPDNLCAPVKLGNNGVTKYSTQRGKIQMYIGEQSYDKLSRIEMLDQILSGAKIEDTTITPKEDVAVAYCGDDWYVTVNSQGVINEYMMQNSNKKEQAMIEKNECIQRITNQLGFISNVNDEQIAQSIGGSRK